MVPKTSSRKRIESRIIWPMIEAMDKGFYCWVDLDEMSLMKFSALRKVVTEPAFNYDNSTQLHATVFFHKGDLPVDPEIPEDRELQAKAREAACWTQEDGDKIVVVLLDAPDLQAVHQELRDSGFVNSFDEYTPHITLGCFHQPISSDGIQAFVDSLNRVIQNVDFTIRFCPRLYADYLD